MPLNDINTEYAHNSDFYLARQPVLNKKQQLCGYELLFRSAATGPANVVDDLMATSAVISHVVNLGIEKVLQEHTGFLNVDANMLLSDVLEFIPPKQIVLEILEHVKPTSALLTRIAELRSKGYRFALDDVVALSDDVGQLLPLVDIIKIDITNLTNSDLQTLAARFKSSKKLLLAEKVETLEQCKFCETLDFDYFQGYYFAKPAIITGKQLSLSEQSLLTVLVLLSSDAENDEIERALKRDSFLSLNILRLVNSAAAGMSTKITGISQAIMILGRRQLKRWIQILMYAKQGEKGTFEPALLSIAATRGALLENIAKRLYPTRRDIADTAFTVGIMSLMDILYNMSMTSILESMVLDDDIHNALINREGQFGDMLLVAEHIEDPSKNQDFNKVLTRLSLSPADVYELELEAFESASSISKAVN